MEQHIYVLRYKTDVCGLVCAFCTTLGLYFHFCLYAMNNLG